MSTSVVRSWCHIIRFFVHYNLALHFSIWQITFTLALKPHITPSIYPLALSWVLPPCTCMGAEHASSDQTYQTTITMHYCKVQNSENVIFWKFISHCTEGQLNNKLEQTLHADFRKTTSVVSSPKVKLWNMLHSNHLQDGHCSCCLNNNMKALDWIQQNT